MAETAEAPATVAAMMTWRGRRRSFLRRCNFVAGRRLSSSRSLRVYLVVGDDGEERTGGGMGRSH
jgi:hypothetical protein